MTMELTGLKESLIDVFKEKGSELIKVLDADQVALVERQLLRYAEFQLMLLAAKYDETIDTEQVETDLEHIYASLSALGEIGAMRAKIIIKDVVWAVLRAVLSVAISALI